MDWKLAVIVTLVHAKGADVPAAPPEGPAPRRPRTTALCHASRDLDRHYDRHINRPYRSGPPVELHPTSTPVLPRPWSSSVGASDSTGRGVGIPSAADTVHGCAPPSNIPAREGAAGISARRWASGSSSVPLTNYPTCRDRGVYIARSPRALGYGTRHRRWCHPPAQGGRECAASRGRGPACSATRPGCGRGPPRSRRLRPGRRPRGRRPARIPARRSRRRAGRYWTAPHAGPRGFPGRCRRARRCRPARRSPGWVGSRACRRPRRRVG